MQKFDEFLASLPEDLKPEERAEKITDFAKKQDERAREQQANNQRWVNDLKKKTDELLSESKKVAGDPDYIFKLHETNPEMAEQIVEKFWNWITVDDLKKGKKPDWDNKDKKTTTTLDPDFDTKMIAYENKKAVNAAKDSFIKSVWFTEDEVEKFENDLKSLSWDPSKLTLDAFKKIAVGIAFDMGKPLASDPNVFKSRNNIIPDWGRWWSRGKKSDSKEYKYNDSKNLDLMKEMWVIRDKPE